MADIVLNQNTRSDLTVWYSVVDDGTVVYISEDSGKAKRYYNNLVAEDGALEEDTVVALETHTKISVQA